MFHDEHEPGHRDPEWQRELDELRAFAAEHGGQVVGFAEAEQIARAGLDRENEMIRGKRAKAAEKGRAIVTRLAPMAFSDPAVIDELTDHITRFSLAGIDSVRQDIAARKDRYPDVPAPKGGPQ